jgi:hypothetical protein
MERSVGSPPTGVDLTDGIPEGEGLRSATLSSVVAHPTKTSRIPSLPLSFSL